MSEPDARARLLARLRRDAYRAGTFTLASGKQSDFFIDCKRVMLTAEGHALLGEVFFDTIVKAAITPGGEAITAVAGVALGGCPLASAVALTSFQRGRPLDALYVRKEAKDHGTKALVEGSVPKGASVVLVEDVLTTGGSSKQALATLRAAGYVVPLIVVLVDRREGGAESLASEGVRVERLFAREDFVS